VLALVCLSGCGFRASNGDGGSTDLSGGGGEDLSGLDLLGVDLTGTTPPDMTMSGGGTGPGPAGALPAGYCCNNNPDLCRSRRCRALSNGTSFCTDDCDHDSLCSVWGGAFKCDTTGTGECIASSSATTCLDPSTYQYGTKAIGACCQSGFDKSGQECVGGLCDATGPTSNPFYCTQGCDGNTPCPAPYTCTSAGFCALPDPNAPYTCQ
jgi:hypothetical protein